LNNILDPSTISKDSRFILVYPKGILVLPIFICQRK